MTSTLLIICFSLLIVGRAPVKIPMRTQRETSQTARLQTVVVGVLVSCFDLALFKAFRGRGGVFAIKLRGKLTSRPDNDNNNTVK
jgi:hypothetical protein